MSQIEEAANILKNGGLVAMPTETVYGLAANALNGEAVAKIFAAKGRPSDNPLIVHVADVDDIFRFNLVSDFPKQAANLAKHFWPGPLTIVLPRTDAIPNEVSAGLDTVAIRLPNHPMARALIKTADLPLAAPSANISGSPSPTTAQHVLKDLNGKIDGILDGGNCLVGVESTVISLCEDKPRLLRPGGITLRQLKEVLGDVLVDDAVLHQLKEGQKASSPGMKYKHYAPKAKVILLKGDRSAYIDYVNKNADNHCLALCYYEDVPGLLVKSEAFGSEYDDSEQARLLFDKLRKIDEMNDISTVYARCPNPDGIGMAVYNRLIRAAGFREVDL
ncbi:MAG: L-threonylcarbamoyladenylate synthase [Bacillota bacterium]|nr:L-threonylcarbamoyladenylate synthase [Bacillota bacterium]